MNLEETVSYLTNSKTSIEALYEAARQKALMELEEEARKILKNHKNLQEFIMCMGNAWFLDNDGNEVEDKAYMRPVNDILEAWDEYLKLTGEPMRFTWDGEVRRNWWLDIQKKPL